MAGHGNEASMPVKVAVTPAVQTALRSGRLEIVSQSKRRKRAQKGGEADELGEGS